MGLGRAMDDIGTGLVCLPMLTDNPTQSFLSAHIRPFSQGFVVERLDGATCLPMVITFETHIQTMWTLSLNDCLSHSLDLLTTGADEMTPLCIPRHECLREWSSLVEDGVLIVFEMRDFTAIRAERQAVKAASRAERAEKKKAVEQKKLLRRQRRARQAEDDSKLADSDVDDNDDMKDDDSEDDGMPRSNISEDDEDPDMEEEGDDSLDELKLSLQYNPLLLSLPRGSPARLDCSSAPAGHRYICLLVSAESRAMSLLQQARLEWKNAARMFDVKDVRGFGTPQLSRTRAAEVDRISSVPTSILFSFLAGLDVFAFGIHRAMQAMDPIKSSLQLDSSTVQGIEEVEMDVSQLMCLSNAANVRRGIGLSCMLGAGYSVVRAVHLVAESQRLHAMQKQQQPPRGIHETKGHAHSQTLLLPLFGVAGSGVFAFANQLHERFLSTASGSDMCVCLHTIDLVILANQCCGHLHESDCVGSGVAVCAGDRLTEAECTRANIVQLTSLLNKRISDVQADINAQARAQKTGKYITTLAIVCVVTSASYAVEALPLMRLLETRLMSTRTLSVFSVVSADSVAGLENVQERADSEDSLGKECWRISGRLLLPVGLPEFVVVVEGQQPRSRTVQSAVTRVKDWIAACHGNECVRECNVLRCSSSMLRMDDDTFELLESRLRQSLDAQTKKLSAGPGYLESCLSTMLRNGISSEATDLEGPAAERCVRPSQCVYGSGGLQAVRTTAQLLTPGQPSPTAKTATSTPGWDVVNLAKALQLLFPRATYTGVALNSDALVVPPLEHTQSTAKTTFMHRMLQLAKVKVMRQRQREHANKFFQSSVESFVAENPRLFDSLQAHACSVHGVLSVLDASHTGSPLKVTVEANSSNIIIREITLKEALGSSLPVVQSSPILYVQGSFTQAERSLLQQLMSLCVPWKLQPLPLLSHEDVPHAQMLDIQRNLVDIFASPSSAVKGSGQLSPVGKAVPDYSDDSPISAMHMEQDSSSGVFDTSLPGGWAFDGVRYVHITGQAQALRPDIDKWVQRWLDMKNAKRGEYNLLLREVNEYLA
jgi:hypothetical protein